MELKHFNREWHTIWIFTGIKIFFMKTKLVILFAAVLFVQATQAQFRIGVKAGTNIVKIDGVSFEDQFRYGYHAGGFSEIALTKNKKLWLQPEVLFSQYSTTLDSNFKSVYKDIIKSDQVKVKLNYLTIPVLLNYKFIGPVYLQAGPQFSILKNTNRTLLQNGGDAFTKGDFSMVGGLQVRLSHLYFTGRYVVGLNNINDIDDQDRWKSQAVQLSVGISL
jgi:hypothetical protein